MLSKDNIKSYISTSTITCPYDKLAVVNCFVLNPARVKSLPKSIDVKLEVEQVDLSHYFDYNQNKNIVDFKTTINEIVSWVSDLKLISSSFNNYLWTKLLDKNQELPEINDCFFTQLFKAVSGRNSVYDTYFKEYAIQTGLHLYFPWMSGTSQVICHVKNEMTTVSKNNIIVNFYSRTKATIRWRLLNLLPNYCSDWKLYIQELTDALYSSIINNDKVNLIVKIKELNKDRNVLINENLIIKAFKTDYTLFICFIIKILIF
jgi:hypothetical protein